MSKRRFARALLVLSLFAFTACGGSEEPEVAAPQEEPPTEDATSPEDGATDGADASPTGDQATDGAGGDGAASGDVAEVCAAGEDEGALVLSTNAQGAEDLSAVFQEQYPGIQVEVLVQTAGQSAETLLTELGANQTPSFDVSYTTPSVAEPLLDAEAMLDVDWTALGVPEEQLMFDGEAVHWIDFVYILSYNTDLVDESQVPSSWTDLLDSDLPVAIDERGHGFGEYALLVGYEDARSFAEQLIQRGNLVYAPTAGGRMATTVASGGAAFGFMDHLSQIMRLQESGAPVDWVRTEEVTAAPFGFYVADGARNANAAQCFVAWAASPEGVAAHEDIANQPPITGFEYDSELRDMILEEWGASVATQSDLSLEEIQENGEFRAEIAELF